MGSLHIYDDTYLRSAPHSIGTSSHITGSSGLLDQIKAKLPGINPNSRHSL